ncbi:MAG: hypothetical protein KAW56_08445 [Candidatus Marinimicrobia bacterium]|nr:hypothetical protein [Candidatus Neomarinimicrobiota bacterium]
MKLKNSLLIPLLIILINLLNAEILNGNKFSNEALLITTGLIAYYPFNGNANDESVNGNDGTVVGATLTTDRFGIALPS